jgi:hypothetical protein
VCQCGVYQAALQTLGVGCVCECTLQRQAYFLVGDVRSLMVLCSRQAGRTLLLQQLPAARCFLVAEGSWGL